MTPASKSRRASRVQLVHSVTGVVPAGAFVVVHLWLAARALQGQAAFDAMVRRLQATPALLAIEVLGVYVPLGFHAAVGAYWVATRTPGRPPSPHERSWTRPMQRLTGATALVFVAWHLWELRLAVARGVLAPADFYPTLTERLSSTTELGIPAPALAYCLGVAAVAYHLSNGLFTFCLGQGLARTRKAARAVSLACSALGAAVFLFGSGAVVYFASGSRLLP